MEGLKINLTLKEVKRLSEKFNVIPLYTEVLADVETPLSTFMKLYDPTSFNFLLESAEGGEKWGRYSFILSGSSFYIRTKGNMGELYDGGRVRFFEAEDPSMEVERVTSGFKPFNPPDLPRFWGGLVGFFAYDFVRFLEPVEDTNPDTIGTYDIYLALTDRVVIHDSLRGSIKVVVPLLVRRGIEGEYDRAERTIRETLEALRKTACPVMKMEEREPLLEHWVTHTDREEFLKSVEKAKEYISRGDIIQVVLSQRFSKEFTGDPLDFYRVLRHLNPSPYMYFLDFGDLKVVGSSPEVLVRLEEGILETRPIAGTRPRSGDPLKDRELEEDLLRDEKERAEHLMLVDLARNDLGRVSKKGSVKVEDFMRVERYSHVMHLVSDVKGELEEGKSPLDVLRATFPAGTVSGAPKVRAMQIISELEKEKRGIYAGSVGYISFQGNMDMAIAIRTAVILSGRVYVQAGAGIVADSVPEKEWEESVNKAKALLKAVEISEGVKG